MVLRSLNAVGPMVRGVVDARTARADKVQVDAFPAAEPPFEASVHVSSKIKTVMVLERTTSNSRNKKASVGHK